jgi:hypothetical protein
VGSRDMVAVFVERMEGREDRETRRSGRSRMVRC